MRYQTLYPPGNGESDTSIAFWLRKGHSAGKPLPQLVIREDANFFVQNWTKKLFFANKDSKLILTIEWYYRSMYCRSNAMIFFKMANLKAISSSATLRNSSDLSDVPLISWIPAVCLPLVDQFMCISLHIAGQIDLKLVGWTSYEDSPGLIKPVVSWPLTGPVLMEFPGLINFYACSTEVHFTGIWLI